LKADHLSGEIGLLNCGPRSATVMALTDIPAFRAREGDFTETEAAYPEIPAAIEVVAPTPDPPP
jgi:CRP-like cAMP-binding protein